MMFNCTQRVVRDGDPAGVRERKERETGGRVRSTEKAAATHYNRIAPLPVTAKAAEGDSLDRFNLVYSSDPQATPSS